MDPGNCFIVSCFDFLTKQKKKAMKNVKMFIAMLAVLPMLMLTTSCNKKASEQVSNVKFKLTDAPAQFDAMFIEVTGVQVHTAASGWVSLHSSLGVINI